MWAVALILTGFHVTFLKPYDAKIQERSGINLLTVVPFASRMPHCQSHSVELEKPFCSESLGCFRNSSSAEGSKPICCRHHRWRIARRPQRFSATDATCRRWCDSNVRWCNSNVLAVVRFKELINGCLSLERAAIATESSKSFLGSLF